MRGPRWCRALTAGSRFALTSLVLFLAVVVLLFVVKPVITYTAKYAQLWVQIHHPCLLHDHHPHHQHQDWQQHLDGPLKKVSQRVSKVSK